MAQLVEHILGKDEVPGPNPGSSSTRKSLLNRGAIFLRVGLLLSLRSEFCGTQNPGRIRRAGTSSLLVSTKRAYLHEVNIRFFACGAATLTSGWALCRCQVLYFSSIKYTRLKVFCIYVKIDIQILLRGFVCYTII